MKNVVSKVLMMFVMSFMLFTCRSNAMVPNVVYQNSSVYYTKEKVSSFCGYTSLEISRIVYNHAVNNEVSIFNEFVETLKNNGYGYFLFNNGSSCQFYIAKPSSFVMLFDSPISAYYSLNYETPIDDYIYFFNFNPKNGLPNTCDMNSYISNGEYACFSYSTSFPKNADFSTIMETNLTVVPVSGGYVWDGESYFYQASSNEPDTPTVDYDLAGLITAITSSDVIKDNRDGREDYFIQPYYTSSDNLYYKIYFYADVVNLACFEFVGRDNRYYYDLDKVSVNGIIAKIFDFFVGDKMNTRCFSAYYNEQDSTYDIYFDGSPLLSDLKSIDSEKNPIIFTTKEIPYFSYTLDSEGNVIAIENTSKNITTSDVTDSEGNVISPSVVEDNTSVSETPWQRLVNIITFIPSKIADAIANKMGFNKVMFILSPLFETIYEIIGVFLACLAFIGRAITFVYTLPTIEASSALFSIDVDTTTKGLAFTGNTWGTHFLSGLDKLKALSWGGASLWSFFEAFVLALVAVIAIKLVRKHYHM